MLRFLLGSNHKAHQEPLVIMVIPVCVTFDGIAPALKDANFAWICMDCNNVDQSARHITHASYRERELK